jgi:rod shape-determining protein MreC
MFGGEHKQTDIAQTAIFTTGSMRASRFYPAVIFTLLIMYGDYSFDLSSKIRLSSSYIFSPFAQFEYLAKDSFNSFDSYFSSQKKLSEEIIALKNQIRNLENQNLVLQNIKTSLNELEELFNLSKSFQKREIFLGKITDFKKFPKELISVEIRTNNITKDMIAFNAFGLIGVIDELLTNSIKILPLHDASLKIPAKNSRTLENLIIVGSGEPKIFQIEEFKKNGDIKEGDEIISSGLGGRFPEGFLLGRVAMIKENDQSNFLLVTVKNTYDFSFGSTILFTKP